ncbi:MAG: lipoate--protein ligase [Bacteroidales bacterium]
MHCIVSEHTDPYFNLASEEYLLKGFKDDFFLLYGNSPTVVIGKHQNAMAEFNFPYVREKNIMVARRISGGGAVYHDPGNLNFTFITSGEEGMLVDYGKYTLPVIQAMDTLGLDVTLGERHQLLLAGKKISGTASHVLKDRVLHHGTLLYSSDLDTLENALRAEKDHYEDRAVRSVRSEITNIRDHLVKGMEITGFRDHLLGHVLETVPGAGIYRYNRKDLTAINALRDTKFSTWEWNFGYSPGYRFSKKFRTGTGEMVLRLHVKKGIILEVRFEGDLQGEEDIGKLEATLTGSLHDPETLRRKLSGFPVGDFIPGMDQQQLLAGLF